MKEFEKQGGIAFIILSYTARDEIFYLPLAEVEAFWKRMEDGGRKSFTYDEVDKRFRVRGCRDMLCPLSGTNSDGSGWPKRRMGVKMIDKRGIVPYNETHTLLIITLPYESGGVREIGRDYGGEQIIYHTPEGVRDIYGAECRRKAGGAGQDPARCSIRTDTNISNARPLNSLIFLTNPAEA